ncbi:MAG: DUF928 domain-containing protein, partial [Cyanobacteria bacterium J06641_2]
ALIPSQKALAVSFSPPAESSAPRRSTGGASRTIFENDSAPRRSTGGASRTIFENDSAPRRSTGGGSRTIFENDSAPRRSTGGGSRTIFENDSAPRRSTGGGARDGRRYLNYLSSRVEQPAAILALLPQSYYGKTVSQRPEIFVYVPKSAARDSVFSLKDTQGNTVYEMNVPISGQPEIISIKAPTKLEIGKEYKWFLALKTDGQLSARTPYVDGWIKRVQPNQKIKASMQQTDLLQRAETFAEQGIWYDCVATLAKLRASQPNNQNLEKEWVELLESVGLNQINKAPIVAFNRF